MRQLEFLIGEEVLVCYLWCQDVFNPQGQLGGLKSNIAFNESLK